MNKHMRMMFTYIVRNEMKRIRGPEDRVTRVPLAVVRQAVHEGKEKDESRHVPYAGKAVADDTTTAHGNDWEFLDASADLCGIALYTSNKFMDAMESMTGKYSDSRVEKFWAAVATRQRDNLPVQDRWTQDERFRVRFRGFLRESNEIYRRTISQRAIENGDKPACAGFDMEDYCRGGLQEAFVAQVIRYFTAKGKPMYAWGALLTYGALLRHEELAEARVEQVYEENGEFHMKITGGKWRKPTETDTVWFEGCKATMVKVIGGRKHGILLPEWNTKIALDGIHACREEHHWTRNRTWDWHCFRHGKAMDMRLKGIPKEERMRRGRWRSEKIEDLYSRHR